MCDPTASLAKGLLVFDYSVADCFVLWITKLSHLLSSSPYFFSLCQHLCWRVRRSEETNHNTEFSLLLISEMWLGVEWCWNHKLRWRCGRVCDFEWLSSCALTTWRVIIGCVWYLSFPCGIIVLKNVLVFWWVLRKSISVDICILVKVTKTYCLSLRQISLKMESQYWALVQIFMYIKDEYLKFMNLSPKYRLFRMCFDKVLFVINTSFSWVEV